MRIIIMEQQGVPVLWLGKLKLKTRASYLKWMGEELTLDVRV